MTKPARRIFSSRACGSFTLVVFLAATIAASSGGAGQAAGTQGPGEVVRAYLRAVYARDFVVAYGFISSGDRRVRDMQRYVRQRGAFSGFVLEAARQVSESIETNILEQQNVNNRIRLRVRYRVPDSKPLAPVLLNWDPYRLNALAGGDRAQILGTLQRMQQDRALEMTTGEDTFELVNESGEWRLFFDWAAGVKIPLRLETPASGTLHAALSQTEVKLQPGDTFEVRLKVKNNTDQPVVARIGHLVEPRSAADYLDFVQCGFLLPVTIEAGREQEYSGTYLLRGSLPENIRELQLTYDFKILE